MKSFPGTVNESKNMYGGGKANSYQSTFDIERIVHGALNLNKSVPVIEEQLKNININIANFQAYPKLATMTNPNQITTDEQTYNLKADEAERNATEDIGSAMLEAGQTEAGNLYMAQAQKMDADINARKKAGLYDTRSQEETIFYENPLQLPAEIIALAKDYDWAYRYLVKEFVDPGEKHGNSLETIIANTSIAPSMFNPMYGVSIMGIIRNTPLLNDANTPGINQKISDCSIRTLCALSKEPNSELGMARYKYADFMYCKDLGKVSNNHLITLRKFPHPVVDHISEMATPQRIQDEYSFETVGDVGRLVTWFGTDDNKLEDIIKFSYHATWKHLEAKIEEKESTADNPNSGIVGMISNAFNPLYNKGVNDGTVGNHSLWSWLGSKLTPKVFQGIGQNRELLTNYDNNKVYSPHNTVQETHLYEGKLEFTHNFTLNFSYKLRAYENINPRSAFLDLIGNILEVTYRRGKFWGGGRKLIGPPQNQAPFRMVNNFIDGAWEKIGNLFSSFEQGGWSMQNILGAISSGATALWKSVLNSVTGGTALENAKELASKVGDLTSAAGCADAFKGMMKNALGRPQAIAWQSLLSGSPAGMWHVMVGNPRNPILSIGNLILENATITQSGPLGIDDFPTELKVSVELKHCTPRDVTDIGRMYTKGAGAIYHVLAGHNIDDFWGSNAAKNIEDGQKEIINPNGNSNKGSTQTTPAATKSQQDAGSSQPKQSTDQRNTIYTKNELSEAQKTNSYYNMVPSYEYNKAHYPNPFCEENFHAMIMRTNNWSPAMLRYALDESA